MAPIHPPTPNKQSPPLGVVVVVVVVGPEKPKTIILNRPTSFLLPTCPLPPPFLRSSLFAVSFCLPTLPTFSSSCSDQTLFVFVPSRKKKKKRKKKTTDRRRQPTTTPTTTTTPHRALLLQGLLACLLVVLWPSERARELSLLRLVCMHERAAVAQAMEGW